MSKKHENYCYVVLYHEDEDRGFGDAVGTSWPIRVFKDEQEAKKYVKANDNDHVYDVPYSELHTGGLSYDKVPLMEKAKKEDLSKEGWN